MITATLPAVADYQLLKFTLNDKDAHALKIINREDVEVPETQVKNIKPQQVMAAMAFRLFGLDVMPIYKANMRFLHGIDYTNRQLTEVSFDGHPNTILHAAQLLRVFVQNDGVAEQGTIQKNNVSEYLSELFIGEDDEDVVCFSKTQNNKEIVIAYNTSETEPKEKFILLDDNANSPVKKLDVIYGYDSCGHMHLFHGKHNGRDVSYIKIYLKPLHLVILKNY